MTPIRCHRPGTAWQNAWSRPSGSTVGPSVVVNTTPDVPRDSEETPGSIEPTPTAAAAWSPPPATTGVPGRSPVAAAASSVMAPVTSGPSKVAGSQRRSIPSASRISADQSRWASSNSMVPAPSARSTAWSPVRRRRTRSFGRSTWAICGPHLGLVAPDPEQLGRREPGERVVAGDGDQALAADELADQVALGARALVVPQDGGPQDPVRRVQRDEAVHLPGEPDRLHVVAARARPARGPRRPRRTVASHQSPGSCSLHSGRGVSYGILGGRRPHGPRPRRPGSRPSWPSSRRPGRGRGSRVAPSRVDPAERPALAVRHAPRQARASRSGPSVSSSQKSSQR